MKRVKERDSAQALAGKFVLDFDQYNTDAKQFRKARRDLLNRLSR